MDNTGSMDPFWRGESFAVYSRLILSSMQMSVERPRKALPLSDLTISTRSSVKVSVKNHFEASWASPFLL